MIQHLLATLGISGKEEAATALPFLLILYAILAVTYAIAVFSVEVIREPLRMALFTALMFMHALLHAFSPRLREAAQQDEDWPWLAAYLSAQGLLLLGMSALAGGQAIVIGLYIALIGEAVAITWPHVRGTILVILACLVLLILSGIFATTIEFPAGWLSAVALLASFALITSFFCVDLSRSLDAARLLRQELELTRQRQQIYATLAEDLSSAQRQLCVAEELQGELTSSLADIVRRLETLDAAQQDGDSENAPLADQSWVLEQAQKTFQLAERASLALQATSSKQGGLIDTLIKQVDQFTTSTGIQATLEVDDLEADVPPDVATGVQRIVQESLVNVARHAQASQVSIQVQTGEDELKVVVQDNGRGFDVAESMLQPECRGLSDMHARARRIGGHLRLESIPGSGTRLVLTLRL
jgi:NarL family two-component system sensor histidine kinase YdfH